MLNIIDKTALPTSGVSFIECITYFTDKDYTVDFQDLIRNEKYRSGVRTSARIQPFCRKSNINIGCFNGKKITPRTITQRIIATKIPNNHFCSIWKSDDISLPQAVKELKLSFKVIDNIISNKHVESFIKNEYRLKKVQSLWTNIVVSDL